MSESEQTMNVPALAIVGMSCRVPGAADLETFWRNLCAGEESIRFFSEEELEAAGSHRGLIDDPSFVRARGVVPEAEYFDAELFGFTPREAETMDPQHRLFLLCAWEALEHSGYDPQRFEGAIGVYAGAGASSYLHQYVLPQRELLATIGLQQAVILCEKDFLPAQVAYKLNLHGPCLGVQTACSSSLVAVHLAGQALLTYQCDMALAGGATLLMPQIWGYRFTPGGVFSSDGHCRAFGAGADGTVPGGGAAVVVLKRLDDALADGDTIYAVIRGSAINNDGKAKAGFMAPSVDGQAEVITMAHAVAGVSADSISLVEAHGTGTAIGDPIEFEALCRAFAQSQAEDRKGFCGLGSVKSNLGHLDTAAGVAGLIKTALALHHRYLPPSLHCTEPNPKLELAESPFFLLAEGGEWAAAEPRRAGVSSFGIGGTNAHVVLEEAPAGSRASIPAGRGSELIVLSAGSEAALDRTLERLGRHLEQHSEIDLADAAYTLQVGRQRLEHRGAFVAGSRREAASKLRREDRGWLRQATGDGSAPALAFVFPGIGDHYPGMGRDLYRQEPVFRRAMDRCARLLEPHLGEDLRKLIWDDDRDPDLLAGPDLRRMLGSAAGEGLAGPLGSTRVAHPAVFAIEWSLAQLWISWGIRPEAVIGYSLGEYTAACVAGVFELEDALPLVARRAELIEELPAGAMLALPLPEIEARALLGAELSLAAVNGPEMSVVAGPRSAVVELAEELTGRGIENRLLSSAHAFHSTMMESVAGPLVELFRRLPLKPPSLPLVSNLSGRWAQPEGIADPGYWGRHLCQPVRFTEGLATLWQDDRRLLLEVGPGQALTSLAIQHPDFGRGPGHRALASMRASYENRADDAVVMSALAQLWLGGAEVDWEAFRDGERRRRVALPTYAFELRSYLLKPSLGRQPASDTSAPLVAKPDPADWFYLPTWRRSPLAAGTTKARSWLVLSDDRGVGASVAEQLHLAGHKVVVVKARSGPDSGSPETGATCVDLAAADAYDNLCRSLRGTHFFPDALLYAWSLDLASAATFEASQERGLLSLIRLTRALVDSRLLEELEMTILCSGLARIEPGDGLATYLASLAGFVNVLTQEHPKTRCRVVDLPAEPSARMLLREQLGDEVARGTERNVAYRRGRRFVAEVVPLPLAPANVELSSQEVVWITGGLGRLSLLFARALARCGVRRLALSSRSGLPPESTWDALLAADGRGNEILRQRISALRELEADGVEVLILSADVSDPVQMAAALAEIEEGFGRLDGVVHAAGLVSEDSMQALVETTAADLEQHAAPKAMGLEVLHRVLGDRELRFRWILSSISTTLGGLGMGAYVAANAIADALAQAWEKDGQAPWISLDWGEVWSLKKTTAVVERLLGMSGDPQVLISPTDLAVRLQRLGRRRSDVARSGATEILPPSKASARAPDRRRVSTPFVEPDSDAERRIAEVWTQLLGVERAGAQDNFFELGGHSLTATRLIARLSEIFGVDVPLGAVFRHPTIAGLALEIEELVIADIEALEEPMEEEKPVAATPQDRGQVRYTLPNGLEITCQNQVEADHFYQDIFVHDIYLRHGVTLEEGACVFDVGGNIGLFSLRAASAARDVTVYTFEPSPPMFELLQANLAAHGVRGQAFDIGLSDRSRQAELTFYPHSSGMSSFYADLEEEKAVLARMIENQRRAGQGDLDSLTEHTEELLEERFRARTFQCQLRTVSEMIEELRVERIDLLKVDVQKSELDVLRGIAASDWPKIRQVVLEVHALDGRLDEIRNLLEAEGFEIVVEQEPELAGTVLYNLFAVRPAERLQAPDLVGAMETS